MVGVAAFADSCYVQGLNLFPIFIDFSLSKNLKLDFIFLFIKAYLKKMYICLSFENGVLIPVALVAWDPPLSPVFLRFGFPNRHFRNLLAFPLDYEVRISPVLQLIALLLPYGEILLLFVLFQPCCSLLRFPSLFV